MTSDLDLWPWQQFSYILPITWRLLVRLWFWSWIKVRISDCETYSWWQGAGSVHSVISVVFEDANRLSIQLGVAIVAAQWCSVIWWTVASVTRLQVLLRFKEVRSDRGINIWPPQLSQWRQHIASRQVQSFTQCSAVTSNTYISTTLRPNIHRNYATKVMITTRQFEFSL